MTQKSKNFNMQFVYMCPPPPSLHHVRYVKITSSVENKFK